LPGLFKFKKKPRPNPLNFLPFLQQIKGFMESDSERLQEFLPGLLLAIYPRNLLDPPNPPPTIPGAPPPFPLRRWK